MKNELIEYLTEDEIKQLSNCNLCPRKCGINRIKEEKGFCNIGLSLSIALIINHKGEEPILSGDKGITNVFFSHCNCQCIFCQNHKISNNQTIAKSLYSSMEETIDTIITTLNSSENILGFVSPTHQIPIMKAIIRELHKRNYYPKIVYNSSGYEDYNIIKQLDGIVDIYLPDWKYANNETALRFSHAKNYSEFATLSIKEMYRQKGSSILTDIYDKPESGLIIRHLILPNNLSDSKKVLDTIAWELSPNVTLSLMSQYNPPFAMPHHDLNRKITAKEYEEIVDFALSLGFHKIFTQELSSTDSVIPDFDNNTFLFNE